MTAKRENIYFKKLLKFAVYIFKKKIANSIRKEGREKKMKKKQKRRKGSFVEIHLI